MAIKPEAVGRTIGTIRKAKGLTQRQVATETGLTVNYLSLLENGQRGVSVEVANKLATTLRVPAEFILFLAGDGKADGKAGKFGELFGATKDAILALIAAESEATK